MSDLRPVMIRLAGDLHRRVKELAEQEDRAVAKWCAMAVREKVERIDASRVPLEEQ